MLIVDDRLLLLESIGATQQLDYILKKEQVTREYVNSKVKELEEEEKNKSSQLTRNFRKIIDLVMSEDFRETTEHELLYCGVSVMGLGPAWTMFVLGFAFPLAWLPGSLYMSSKLQTKKIAGVCNFLMLCLVVSFIVGVCLGLSSHYAYALLCIVGIGAIITSVVFYYRHKRLKLKANVWKQLRKLVEQKPKNGGTCI